jgi:hypothetical protein
MREGTGDKFRPAGRLTASGRRHVAPETYRVILAAPWWEVSRGEYITGHRL